MADKIQLEYPDADCDWKSQASPDTYGSAQTTVLNLHIQCAHRVNQAAQTLAPAMKINQQQ